MSTTVKRPEMPHPEGAEKARTGSPPSSHATLCPPTMPSRSQSRGEGISSPLVPMGCSARVQRCRSPAAALLAGPSIAGVLLTGLVDGRPGLRRLVSGLRRWRVGARWYAVALLTGPFVMGATVFALSLASPEFRPDFLTADNKLSIVLTGIVLGLMGGFFEELGWTGFALPRLRRRYGVVTTGLVMGLLWGAWHFPMFAGTTDPTGILPAALVVAVLLFAWLPPYRVLIVWVYDRTESLLIAMLMHVPISVTTFVLASEATTSAALVVPVLISGAAFWVIVAVVAWANAAPSPDVRTRRRRKACRSDAEARIAKVERGG